MFHALDENTKKFIGLESTLSATEQKVVSDNREFFSRVAIHVIAEHLLESPDKAVPAKFKKNIHKKSSIFMQMMTYPAPKAGADDPHDPAKAYGWNRTDKATKIRDLQVQYQDATRRCYALGFQHFLPRFFELFTPNADYWFKVLAGFLVCDEHIAMWSVQLAEGDHEAGTVPMQAQVLQWGNKLLMLKQHASSSETQKEMDVDAVTTFLNSVGQLALAKGQTFSKANAERLQKALAEADLQNPTEEFKDMFKEYAATVKERALGMRDELSMKTLELTNGEHPIEEFIHEYWKKRVPDPATHSLTPAPKKLTYRQVIETLEDLDPVRKLAQKTTNQMSRQLEDFAQETGDVWGLGYLFDQKEPQKMDKSFTQWMKDVGGEEKATEKLKTGWTKTKALLHGGCAILLAYSLGSGSANWKDAVQITLTLTSEVMGVLKSGATRLFTAVYGKFQVCGNMVAWLKDTIVEAGSGLGKRIGFELVGNIGKFCRTLGESRTNVVSTFCPYSHDVPSGG
jgi:hypothetical protein